MHPADAPKTAAALAALTGVGEAVAVAVVVALLLELVARPSAPPLPDDRPGPLPPHPGLEPPAPHGQGDTPPAAIAPLPGRVPEPALPAHPGFTAAGPIGPQIVPMGRPKLTSREMNRQTAILKRHELPTWGRYRYIPPRTWTSSQPLPVGPRHGFMDEDGNEWVMPSGKLFGEWHWDVQMKGGGHRNITKNGRVARHGSKD